MNFKVYLLCFFLFSSPIIFGFPELSLEDQKVQAELTKKINEDPKNVDLRFELAMEYASTGWIELGWDQLKLIPKLEKNYEEKVFLQNKTILAQDPTNWKAHFRIAFAYYFKNNKINAISSFKKVLAINPSHVWSMGLIGLIYGEQKNYDQCIYWSIKALKINDDATAIHFLLGQAYYETGNYLGVIGETLSVGRLKSIEAKYRPTPPKGIE